MQHTRITVYRNNLFGVTELMFEYYMQDGDELTITRNDDREDPGKLC